MMNEEMWDQARSDVARRYGEDAASYAVVKALEAGQDFAGVAEAIVWLSRKAASACALERKRVWSRVQYPEGRLAIPVDPRKFAYARLRIGTDMYPLPHVEADQLARVEALEQLDHVDSRLIADELGIAPLTRLQRHRIKKGLKR